MTLILNQWRDERICTDGIRIGLEFDRVNGTWWAVTGNKAAVKEREKIEGLFR